MSEAPSFVRLAGRGRGSDGAIVTWTIAEGRRGRRWRETVVRDGVLVHSLLYETDRERRFSHLELATPTGLVTLHPEGDGTLHGNIIRPGSGIEHIVGLSFPAATLLLVGGSTVASVAAAWAGQGSEHVAAVVPAVVLDPMTLALSSQTVDPSTLGPSDNSGVPVMDGARIWPLEGAELG
jgi:hypothetical protein